MRNDFYKIPLSYLFLASCVLSCLMLQAWGVGKGLVQHCRCSTDQKLSSRQPSRVSRSCTVSFIPSPPARAGGDPARVESYDSIRVRTLGKSPRAKFKDSFNQVKRLYNVIIC